MGCLLVTGSLVFFLLRYKETLMSPSVCLSVSVRLCYFFRCLLSSKRDLSHLKTTAKKICWTFPSFYYKPMMGSWAKQCLQLFWVKSFTNMVSWYSLGQPFFWLQHCLNSRGTQFFMLDSWTSFTNIDMHLIKPWCTNVLNDSLTFFLFYWCGKYCRMGRYYRFLTSRKIGCLINKWSALLPLLITG